MPPNRFIVSESADVTSLSDATSPGQIAHSPGLCDPCGSLLELVTREAEHAYPCPFPGESQGDLPPEPPARTGDERGLVFKIHNDGTPYPRDQSPCLNDNTGILWVKDESSPS